MKRGDTRRLSRGLVGALSALAALAVAAQPASSRPSPPPSVDIQHLAILAPDGSSLGVQVIASCAERWNVVEAVVRVSQPGASGQASFPLVCIGSLRVFNVVVPAQTGSFGLGDAQVSASVVVKRGRTESARDSELLDVTPGVLVELAQTARLESAGAAVTIDVTVACPAGTTGLLSRINVSQAGVTSGNGTYLPVCDGDPHTFAVRVEATVGLYRAGSAQALTFAGVAHEGETFFGIDDGTIEIVG